MDKKQLSFNQYSHASNANGILFKIPTLTPVRNKPIHMQPEASIMVTFQKMNQFMHQNILQTLRRLLN